MTLQDGPGSVEIKDANGKTLKIPGSNQEARYFLPVNCNIYVNDGDVDSGRC